MRGEEGQGRLVGLHSELVARRCLMTCQLGGIFQLGPVTGENGCKTESECEALAGSELLPVSTPQELGGCFYDQASHGLSYHWKAG